MPIRWCGLAILICLGGIFGSVRASMIECKITHTHLKVGLKGNPPFLDVSIGLFVNR